jgi:hypothetical protein
MMAAGISITAAGKHLGQPHRVPPAIARLMPPVEYATTPNQQAIVRFRDTVDGIYGSSGFLDTCGGMLVILGLIGLKEIAIDNSITSQATRSQWDFDPYAPTLDRASQHQ